jgi:hypothetical protein
MSWARKAYYAPQFIVLHHLVLADFTEASYYFISLQCDSRSDLGPGIQSTSVMNRNLEQHITENGNDSLVGYPANPRECGEALTFGDGVAIT